MATIDCLRCGAVLGERIRKPTRNSKRGEYTAFVLTPADYIVHACGATGMTPCWIWKWMRNRGYAYVRHQNSSVLLNRIQLGIVSEPFTKAQTLHACDNPPCVNPRHISVGTVRDNRLDCEAKGRAHHAVGEHHGRTNLTAQDVINIRARVAAGESMRAMARAYGVSPPSIYAIVRRTSWAWL